MLARAGTAPASRIPVTVLEKAASVRTQALSDASVALSQDPSLLWANPACIFGFRQRALTLGGYRGFFKDFTAQLVLSSPLSFANLSLGIVYLDAGTASMMQEDGSVQTINLQQDVLGAMSACLPIFNQAAVGVNLKGMRSEMPYNRIAKTVAADIGAQVAIGEVVRIGCVYRNLGGSLDYGVREYNIRGSVHAGVATTWKIQHGSFGGKTDKLVLLAESAYDFDEFEEYAIFTSAGIEYQMGCRGKKRSSNRV